MCLSSSLMSSSLPSPPDPSYSVNVDLVVDVDLFVIVCIECWMDLVDVNVDVIDAIVVDLFHWIYLYLWLYLVVVFVEHVMRVETV